MKVNEYLARLGAKIDELQTESMEGLRDWVEAFEARDQSKRLLVLVGQQAGALARLLEGDEDGLDDVCYESTTVLLGGAGELITINADGPVGNVWQDWQAALEEMAVPKNVPKWFIVYTTRFGAVDLPPAVEAIAVKVWLAPVEEAAEVG